MKASELIEELQEQIKLHGDCEVWFDCEVELEGYNGDYTLKQSDCVSSTYFKEEDKSIHIC